MDCLKINFSIFWNLPTSEVLTIYVKSSGNFGAKIWENAQILCENEDLKFVNEIKFGQAI